VESCLKAQQDKLAKQTLNEKVEATKLRLSHQAQVSSFHVDLAASGHPAVPIFDSDQQFSKAVRAEEQVRDLDGLLGH
jgi:hypothetical protein